MKKRYWIAGAATAAMAAKLLLRPRDIDWEKDRELVFHSDYSRFAEVRGLRVHHQEAGESNADPIFLIHGFASSTLMWSRVFLQLAAAGFRVIAPDLIGCGYSDKPGRGEYTIEMQARLIMGLMDQMGIEQATIVGSSYGGAVAATCALDYPDRVEKLVLVGAVNNNEPLKYSLLRVFGSPLIGDVVAPLLIGSRRLLRRRMKRVYDRHSWALDEKRVEARHRPLRTRATHRAIIRTIRSWNAERVSVDAHLIKQPTLLLWGDTDQDVPLADGRRLEQLIEGSRLIVFPDCGHLPHEEYPEAFTEVIANFCADQSIMQDAQAATAG
ncbi:MAG TPA: alpha/beta hydrolase [Pyrinomonadaceae bacterium]|nr:alpha/beta hydrolase [Pyrinomonadaceae bacterium]